MSYKPELQEHPSILHPPLHGDQSRAPACTAYRIPSLHTPSDSYGVLVWLPSPLRLCNEATCQLWIVLDCPSQTMIEQSSTLPLSMECGRKGQKTKLVTVPVPTYLTLGNLVAYTFGRVCAAAAASHAWKIRLNPSMHIRPRIFAVWVSGRRQYT